MSASTNSVGGWNIPRPETRAHFGRASIPRCYQNGQSAVQRALRPSESPRQPLLARVEELVHQILRNPNVAREQVGEEEFGEGRLIIKHVAGNEAVLSVGLLRTRMLDGMDMRLQ